MYILSLMDLFVYLFGRKRSSKIFKLLVHSPNAYTSQVWSGKTKERRIRWGFLIWWLRTKNLSYHLLPCKVHIRKLDEKQKWASDPGTQICYTGFSSRAFTNCTKMPKLYLVVLNKTHLIVLSLNALPETIWQSLIKNASFIVKTDTSSFLSCNFPIEFSISIILLSKTNIRQTKNELQHFPSIFIDWSE